MTKTKEQIMLTEAFDKFDISLLQKCLDAGYDMNAVDDFGDSYLSEALFSYGAEEWAKTDVPVKQVISFIDFALKQGLNINHTYDDCGEIIGDAFVFIKYCDNNKVVEFLLQNGLNINYKVYSDVAFYDSISSDIFAQECANGDGKFMYERTRLITYYGAKPSYLLENKDTKDENKLYDIILSLDLEKISSLSANEIIEKKLDSVMIIRGQFVYPKEWYKDSKSYQKKMISVFEVLLEKINIDQISNDILYECVYQQLPDLLEFLLEKGANPNVNCFNKAYAYVKSSAMYELRKRGCYFTEELYERFMNALLSHGAML